MKLLYCYDLNWKKHTIKEFSMKLISISRNILYRIDFQFSIFFCWKRMATATMMDDLVSVDWVQMQTWHFHNFFYWSWWNVKHNNNEKVFWMFLMYKNLTLHQLGKGKWFVSVCCFKFYWNFIIFWYVSAILMVIRE